MRELCLLIFGLLLLAHTVSCKDDEASPKLDGMMADSGIIDGMVVVDGTPDAPAIECTSYEPIDSPVDVDRTLPPGCYIVEEELRIIDGATLTIEPPATILFKQDAGISVGAESALKAVGTADKPILFTGEQKTRGFWRGIVLTDTQNTNNRLAYAHIMYGGGSAIDAGIGANLFLYRDVTISVENTVLGESKEYGFYLADDSNVTSFATNTVTANTLGAGVVTAKSAGMLDASTQYTGNDRDVVLVRQDTVDTDMTWPAIDASYLIEGTAKVLANLTVGAGAELVFMQDAKLEVGQNGSLEAVGTAEKPILFTGEQKTRGYWEGLLFLDTDSTQNQLEHVTVEYGGGFDFDASVSANLFLYRDVRLSVKHTTLRESAGYGFYLADDSTVTAWSDNTVTANALGAGHVTAQSAGQLDDAAGQYGNTFAGNDADRVLVVADHLTTDQTWPGIDVPYVLSGIANVEAQLTIGAGATLSFEQDAYIAVDDTGTFTAVGTVSEKILFTGEQKSAGFWGGIVFYNTNKTGNKLQHATVEYGGGFNANGDMSANVFLYCSTPSDVTRLEMTDCTIQHSKGYGLWIASTAVINGSDAGSGNVTSVNTFSDNQSGDVYKEPP